MITVCTVLILGFCFDENPSLSFFTILIFSEVIKVGFFYIFLGCLSRDTRPERSKNFRANSPRVSHMDFIIE
jgi:hypothetical protein